MDVVRVSSGGSAAYLIYRRQKRRHMFFPVFVCLSVSKITQKNACMDLDEMLRVDRCRDMDELQLINF